MPINNGRKKRFVVSGWYGNRNMGDESIMASIVLLLRNEYPDSEFRVYSDDPKYSELTPGIDSFHHIPFDIGSFYESLTRGDLSRSFMALDNNDLFILGGGGFLSDWQTWRVMFRWLTPVIFFKIFGGKVMVYGIGAGPIKTRLGKCWARFVLNHYVDAITVRDERSHYWLKQAGVTTKIEVTGDPAIQLPQLLGGGDQEDENLRRQEKVSRVGVVLSPHFHLPQYWPNSEGRWKKLWSAYIELVEGLVARGMDVELIPFQDPEDLALAQDIGKHIVSRVAKAGEAVKIAENTTPQQTHNILREMDVVISIRLHGCILAAAEGVPVIGIIYHHKTEEFLRRINMIEFAASIGEEEGHDLDVALLLRNFDHIIDNYGQIRERLRSAVKEEKIREEGNLRVLKSLIEDGRE